jgi:hypothetical protein
MKLRIMLFRGNKVNIPSKNKLLMNVLRLFCITIFLLNINLLGDEIKEAPKYRWGIGVGYDPQFVSIQKDRPYDWEKPGVKLYVPFLFSTWKIEPEMGFWKESYSDDSTTEPAKYETGIFQGGLGTFYNIKKNNSNFYFGPRFGALVARTTEYSTANREIDTFTKTGFYGGPSAGVEHFVTDSISLGIEGQMLYMNLPALGEKYLALDYASTRGVLFLRWYY